MSTSLRNLLVSFIFVALVGLITVCVPPMSALHATGSVGGVVQSARPAPTPEAQTAIVVRSAMVQMSPASEPQPITPCPEPVPHPLKDDFVVALAPAPQAQQ
jgi:hypothetical protein